MGFFDPPAHSAYSNPIIKKREPDCNPGMTSKNISYREKYLKTIQFFIRVLLYHNITSAKSLSHVATQLAITQQVFNLGNAMSYIQEIQTPQKEKRWLIFIRMINAFSDDIYCLYQLGILPKKIGIHSKWVSSRCFFIRTMVELQSYYIFNAEPQKGQQQAFKKVNIAKCIVDLLFCGMII